MNEPKETPAVTPAATETITETPQNLVKKELEKVKSPKTEAEKAAYSLQMNAKRAMELGLKPEEILGFSTHKETTTTEDDNRPVTVGDLKKIQAAQSQKTSLQLADEITDEDERELTKHYLQTRIVPSGNPADDLRFARSAVNSIKNGQIAEEVARKVAPKTSTNGSGAPARVTTNENLTPEETPFLRAPWNMTKEQILASRPKQS